MYYMLNLCLLTPTIFSYVLFFIEKYYYYMLPPCLDRGKIQKLFYTDYLSPGSRDFLFARPGPSTI